jgi:hypothetical protein
MLQARIRDKLQGSTVALPNFDALARELLQPGIYIAAGAVGGAIGKKALETLTEEITKAILRWRPFKKPTSSFSIPIYGPDGNVAARVQVPANPDNSNNDCPSGNGISNSAQPCQLQLAGRQPSTKGLIL